MLNYTTDIAAAPSGAAFLGAGSPWANLAVVGTNHVRMPNPVLAAKGTPARLAAFRQIPAMTTKQLADEATGLPTAIENRKQTVYKTRINAGGYGAWVRIRNGNRPRKAGQDPRRPRTRTQGPRPHLFCRPGPVRPAQLDQQARGDGTDAVARRLVRQQAGGVRVNIAVRGGRRGRAVRRQARRTGHGRERDRGTLRPRRCPAGLDLPCTDDPELFFAEAPADVEAAKALCQGCRIRDACLEGALERREPWGVWGGELLLRGTIVPRKRPRGRPRKDVRRRANGRPRPMNRPPSHRHI